MSSGLHAVSVNKVSQATVGNSIFSLQVPVSKIIDLPGTAAHPIRSFIIHPCNPTVVICCLIWPCDIAVCITYLISHSLSLSYNTAIKGNFRLGYNKYKTSRVCS